MKKIVVSLCVSVLSLLFAQSSFAQNIDNLIAKYANIQNATTQSFDSTMMVTGQTFDWAKQIPFEGKIDSLIITDLSNCTSDIKIQFVSDFQSIPDINNNETVLSIDKDGNTVRMIANIGYNFIHNVYIFAVTKDKNAVIVNVFGRITEIDPQRLVKEAEGRY